MEKLNAALELGRLGKWDEAWEVAQTDETLLPGVEREAWVAFAQKTISLRDTPPQGPIEGWD